MSTTHEINVLSIDTYAELIAVEDAQVVMVNADHAGSAPRWQINIPVEYAADLIAEIAKGLAGRDAP